MNGTRRKVCWSVRACIYNEGTREGERKKVELVLSKIFKWVPDASANYAPILVLGFSMFVNLIRVPGLFQSWPFVGRAVTTKVNIDFYVKWMDLFILQQKFMWCKLLFRFFKILSDEHGSINRDNQFCWIFRKQKLNFHSIQVIIIPHTLIWEKSQYTNSKSLFPNSYFTICIRFPNRRLRRYTITYNSEPIHCIQVSQRGIMAGNPIGTHDLWKRT